MTAAELDALEALANAATPGPWGSSVMASDSWRTYFGTGPHHPRYKHMLYDAAWPDADFIAASREAIPKLIARVRELESERVGHCGCWQKTQKVCDRCRSFVRDDK